MDAIVIALIMILCIDQETMTCVNIVHFLQIYFKTSLSPGSTIRNDAASGIILLLDLV